MEIVVSFIILITFLGTMYPTRDTPKGSLEILPNMVGANQMAQRHIVTPFTEITDANIVKQQYDYSCGSAALATLLNFYLGERFGEQQVIQGLMQYGEAERIQERRAFSLLDMKRFVEVLGYNGAGYKAEIDDLRTIGKPVIVPIEVAQYKHFVVFRGIYGDHVFLADPFLGQTSYTLKRFKEMWSQNILFVVSSDTVRVNAMALSEEDLRIIDYDMVKYADVEVTPPVTVNRQREVIESTGTKYFRTVNLK